MGRKAGSSARRSQQAQQAGALAPSSSPAASSSVGEAIDALMQDAQQLVAPGLRERQEKTAGGRVMRAGKALRGMIEEASGPAADGHLRWARAGRQCYFATWSCRV